MNQSSQRLGRLAGHLIALVFCTLGIAPSLMAQDYGIIDDVQFFTSAKGPKLRISFNRPAQYIGHTPKSQGSKLFVDLRLIGPPSDLQIPRPQQLRFKPTDEVPLTAVSYREEGNSRARMELSFATPVDFEVSAESDFQGISIILTKLAGQVQEVTPAASAQVEKRVDELMNLARKALIDERNFAKAINLYQQVLNQPPNSRSRDALEYLGLARERSGQRIEAVAVYEDYLARYPDGGGSERVRQRLMSLQTATMTERDKLREAKKEEKEGGWETYGSFYQYYLRDVYRIDNSPTVTTASAISSDIDIVATRRSDSSDSRLRITAGHYHDLLDDEGKRSTRLSSLYAEHHDNELGWWGRVGRQTSNRDGTLGRFDGIKLGYALAKRVEASVVAGYPVDSSRDTLNTDRTFGGMALDFGPYNDSWEFSLYGIEQRLDTLVDRRALGGEVRYFQDDLVVLSMLDYDAFYKEVNIGMLLANWTLPDETTLSATIDVRKTPTLSVRNALQGQVITATSLAVTDMDQLRSLYSDDAIYQLAKDRSAQSRTLTLGLSRPLSEKYRLAADLSVVNVDPTEATAATAETNAIAAIPGSGNQYFLSTQLIGSGIINGDDLTTLGLRWSNASTVSSVGLFASSRLPMGANWKVYPRLMIDQRTWKNTDKTQLRLSPLIRAEYSWKKLIFDAELGTEWTDSTLPDDTERTTGLYGSIGYRYEF